MRPFGRMNRWEYDAKADVPVGMSAVGGGADVACQGLSGPFLARSGHSMRRLFGRLSTREFKRLYGHVGMWELGDEGVGIVREAGHDGRSMT